MVASSGNPCLYLFSIVIFDLFSSSEGKWSPPPSRSKWCQVRWGRISWPMDTHTLYPRFEYVCVCVFFHPAEAPLISPAFLCTFYSFYYYFQPVSLALVTQRALSVHFSSASSGRSAAQVRLGFSHLPLPPFYLGLHQEQCAPRVNASKQCRPSLPLSLGVYVGLADSISALHRPHRATLRFTTRENSQRKRSL